MSSQGPRLRVCMLYSDRARRHVMIQRLIHTLIDAGVEVALLDQDSGPPEAEPSDYHYVQRRRVDFGRITKVAWKFTCRIPAPRMHKKFWQSVLWFRVISNAFRLSGAALDESADCYIAGDLVSAIAAHLVARLRGRPMVYWAFEIESEQGDRDEVRRSTLRNLERFVVPRVDYLVSPNRSRANFYTQRYGTRKEPVVILNCPPTVNLPQSNRLRISLGLGESTRVVLYHGAMIPFRSLDTMIESVRYFDRDIVLVLIGEQGEYFHDVLAPRLKDERVRNRVFTLPYLPPNEVSPFVTSADLGVVIYENVNLNNYYCAPMKLYEYVMMRVPFVGCDFPEITEFLRQYPVGVTFNPADPKSIAMAVNSFFKKSSEEREEIAKTLDRARECFSWEREGQKWLELLQSEIVLAPRIARRWART